MKKMFLMAAFGVASLLAMTGSAQAQCESCGDGGAYRGGPTWHGAYSHSEYGGPVALAIPHRARKQVDYMWGNPSSQTTHIRSRFGRSVPGSGGGYNDGGFSPTPAWPSHTNQFGVYYVRVPRRY